MVLKVPSEYSGYSHFYTLSLANSYIKNICHIAQLGDKSYELEILSRERKSWILPKGGSTPPSSWAPGLAFLSSPFPGGPGACTTLSAGHPTSSSILCPKLDVTWHILSVKVQLRHPFSGPLSLALPGETPILPPACTGSVLSSRRYPVHGIQSWLICSPV